MASNIRQKQTTAPVQTGVTAAPQPAHEPAPTRARKPESLGWRCLKALASLRLTVVLFVLSFVLVFYGTVAQIDNGIWTVVDQYFRSWVVFIPLRLNFQVLAVFFGLPAFKVPGSIPFPAGYTLGFLLLANLLAAHAVRFKFTWARGGIMLLHLGVILMLLGELATGLFSREGDMIIPEGHARDWVYSLRETELAFITPGANGTDDVVVVPAHLLAQKPARRITNEKLPVDLEVKTWMPNSGILTSVNPASNPATAGTGLTRQAADRPVVSGTDPEQKADYPAAYVTFYKKETDEALGTYLVSPSVDPEFAPQIGAQSVTVEGKDYEVALRFKRTYKPYRVHLIKFIHKVFPGAPNKAREYTALVELEHPLGSPKREYVITMNSPLRVITDWSGPVPLVDTLFQSSFLEGDSGTILHIVDNRSWLMPYISCTLVAVGMLWHFLVLMPTALRRAALKAAAGRTVAGATELLADAGAKAASKPGDRTGWQRWVMPLGIGIPVLYFLYCALPVRDPAEGLHLQAFGKLPVQTGGRVQPLDTLARNELLILGTREWYYEEKLEPGAPPKKEEDKDWVRRPAIKWLLEVLTARFEAERNPQYPGQKFEIDPQLAAVLKVRSGADVTFAELRPVVNLVKNRVLELRALPFAKLTPLDKQMLLLEREIRWFEAIGAHITPHRVFRIENDKVRDLLDLPRREGMRYGLSEFYTRLDRLLTAAEKARQVDSKTRSVDEEQMLRTFNMVQEFQNLVLAESLKHPRMLPPFADPTVDHWEILHLDGPLPQDAGEQRAASDLRLMLATYYIATKGPERERPDAIAKFNELATDYQTLLDEAKIPGTSALGLEQRYTSMAPFYQVVIFYFLALILSLVGLVLQFGGERAQNVGRGLMRGAFWMTVVTVALHTVALIVRMYLQGRPPVTNLYSSAIFIGWGCVLLGLFLDVIYRTGLGTLAGCALGGFTGLVGVFLASTGDTMEMMEAVLDTNFWLATHVVCITLGYTTTFLAGALGIAYLLMWLPDEINGKRATQETRKVLASMIYGVVCFAMLLSFVGTVLGGIWADQSWGRFWGWDPKENGAILIVIWNALILHARWGGMVKATGTAGLAVAGNMVVVWSWFGTNQLGVGLHAYGFSNTLAMVCVGLWLSHLAILGLLAVPAVLRMYGWTPPPPVKSA